jgi:hypothetical protein
MDVGIELANISLWLQTLSNEITYRHVSRATAAERVNTMAHTLMNLKFYIDRNLEVRPSE